MRLEIPGYSRYYLETDDNRIYSKYYRPMSERINPGDHNHPVCELSLTNDYGEHKIVKKHRLVYMAYHPDEVISELQINHLDEDSLNNCPENLQACTGKENINWGTCRKRISRCLKGIPNLDLAIAVKATVIETGEVEYYESMAEAQRQLGKHVEISKCCRGEKESAAGRTWEYYYGG